MKDYLIEKMITLKARCFANGVEMKYAHNPIIMYSSHIFFNAARKVKFENSPLAITLLYSVIK